MRLVLVVGAVAGICCWAQTRPAQPQPGQQPPKQPSAQQTIAPPPQPPALAQQASTQSSAKGAQSQLTQPLAKQRLAAMQQITSVMGKAPTPAASFFTVPWVETPVPFNSPPCDPLPDAELNKLALENAQQQGVKQELVRAVIDEESGGRPCAVSWKGAQGLMQLMPETAQELGVKDVFDPSQNVEAGTRLLKQLLTRYNDDVKLALAAYNAGAGRVDQDGAVPAIPETQKYVKDIQSKLPKK
jgi:soluble lytic murein transglycosylase-like protein